MFFLFGRVFFPSDLYVIARSGNEVGCPSVIMERLVGLALQLIDK